MTAKVGMDVQQMRHDVIAAPHVVPKCCNTRAPLTSVGHDMLRLYIIQCDRLNAWAITHVGRHRRFPSIRSAMVAFRHRLPRMPPDQNRARQTRMDFHHPRHLFFMTPDVDQRRAFVPRQRRVGGLPQPSTEIACARHLLFGFGLTARCDLARNALCTRKNSVMAALPASISVRV